MNTENIKINMSTIKEIEIVGFKSFAYKTKLSFNSSFTAIVGPNGCGKSNTLDAIKWVLGEKSVRSMRGDKMEDVIFSGTDTKSPAGFAYVHLLMDNRNRILNVDFDEVKIARKLFRDGQSQYFINDSRVTRKEIEMLLMDTGLGKASYSFMQQGQMDMILSSKPDERRLIFEEAAGISRFKNQKDEAMQKLDNTELNITRLKDILHELERELKVKQNQSVKTLQYNKMAEKLKDHDLRIRYCTFRDIDKNLETYQQKLLKQQNEIEKSRQKIIHLEEKILEAEKEKEKLVTDLHQIDVTNQINSEKITQWNALLVESKKRSDELDQEIKRIKDLMEKYYTRLQDLKAQRDRQSQLSLQLDHQLENAEKTIGDLEIEIKKIEQEITEFHKAIEELTRSVNRKKEELKGNRDKLTVIVEDLLNYLTEEKTKWSANIIDIEKTKTAFIEKIKKLDAELNQLDKSEKNNLSINNFITETKKYFSSTEWIEMLNVMTELERDFWNKLFDKEGIHTNKEKTDQIIERLEKEVSDSELKIIELGNTIDNHKDKKILLLSNRDRLLGEKKGFEVKKLSIEEADKNILHQINHEESQYKYFREQLSKVELEKIQILKKDKEILAKIKDIKLNMAKEITRIDNIKSSIEKSDKKKNDITSQIHKENNSSQGIFTATNDLEVKIGTLLGSREVLIQDIYNDYNISHEEIEEKFKRKNIDIQIEKDRYKEIKKEIDNLGPINPLAIEECQAIESLYNHNKSQLTDIQDAKKHILDVLKEIQTKSETIFLETFDQIKENFRNIFQSLFKGGDVELTLSDREKPLDTGIEIQVQPPGKKARSLKLLSGGEKALTAIALMFGIYKVRSSPFCVLDEIDAPLDDQNVTRFLDMLEMFREKTQFVLITHNKATMARSDAIYGVTMEDPGVSRLLTVELKK